MRKGAQFRQEELINPLYRSPPPEERKKGRKGPGSTSVDHKLGPARLQREKGCSPPTPVSTFTQTRTIGGTRKGTEKTPTDLAREKKKVVT